MTTLTTRARAPLAVATAALLVGLAGCGAPAAPSSAAATTPPAVSASPTAAPAPVLTVTAAPATTVAKPQVAGTLECPSGAIAPAGAVFCYTVPTGFVDATSAVKVDKGVGGDSGFLTAVALTAQVDRDVISVQQFGVPVDTDTYSDDDLQRAFTPTVQQFAKASNTTVTAANPALIQVDGARAFVYEQTGPEYSAHQYFIFRGKHEVQVSCQYKQQQADIERGCAAVLPSLQVASS